MNYKPRKGRFKGRPLRKVLGTLPNNGVGSLIIRGSEKQVEGKPTYFRIVEADLTPITSEKNRRITVSVKAQKVLRGVILPDIRDLSDIAHHPDYQVVKKEDEHKYLDNSVSAAEKGLVASNTARWESAEEYNDEKDDEVEILSKNAEKPVTEEGAPKRNADINKRRNRPETLSKYANYRGLSNSQVKKRQRNYVRSLTHYAKLRKAYKQEKFDDFTEEQMQRINKMIENGMNSDTAKQMEWERETAIKSKR